MKITTIGAAARGCLAGGLILSALGADAGAAPAAFTHPGVLLGRADLDAVKADLDKEPWKSAYERLKADARSQKAYVMRGPCAAVSRNPDSCRSEWENDMLAVYNLARMW
ncbi:MAG TPA: hypothetical protein VF616_10825 [Duganella sp.]|uniref:hypothetical protein n=1 Tax=Duganella sp. TaxID=1904440 RepID=UPI002ED5FC7F